MDEFIQHMEARAEYLASIMSENHQYDNLINIDLLRGALQEIYNLIVYAKILKQNPELKITPENAGCIMGTADMVKHD